MIKIDVKGAEEQVLAGGCALIASHRPPILLEHEGLNFNDPAAAQRAKQALSVFFQGLDYQVFYQSHYNSQLWFPVRWDRPFNGDLIALP